MGMSNTGCCCGETPTTCRDCPYDVRICCLKLENSGWNMYATLLDPENLEFYSGDTCDGPRPLPTANTNMCGTVSSLWRTDPASGSLIDVARPVWDNTSHACMPYIQIVWSKHTDCEQVVMRVKMSWRGLVVPFPPVILDKDWYTAPVVIEDEWFRQALTAFGGFYSGSVPDLTITLCPESYLEFPEPDARVYLEADLQTYEAGDWVSINPTLVPYNNPAGAYGNLVCGKSCKYAKPNYSHTLSWSFDPYKDKVLILSQTPDGLSHTFAVDYADGTWPDNLPAPYVVESEDGPVSRTVLTRVEGCPEGSTSPSVPKSCFTTRLCVLLSVDDGASYEYYDLIWNSVTEKYELSAHLVPGGKPYTIEITLVEDTTTSPGGYREWDLTVIIRDSEGDIVLTYTETYVIDCTQAWTRSSDLVVPIDPEETWQLQISTTCPAPPDPPECDPSCWPECVMCPERKNLYLVIDDDPDCCLAGSYALTWSGTGTTGTYSLASPTGTTTTSCGLISAFTVSCVDATHISVTMTYRVIYAPSISALTETFTLAVSCVGGQMESATRSYTLSGDQDGLCGSGSDYGGTIRVVSA